MKTKMTIQIDIRIEGDDWTGVPDIRAMLDRCTGCALETAGFDKSPVAISVLLTSDRKMQEINAKWRGIDKPTTILSFPAPAGEKSEDGATYLGDLVIAYGVVRAEAERQMKTFATHFCHLVVHGILHLLGHEHDSDDDARVMEALEVKALRALGIANPYESNYQELQR